MSYSSNLDQEPSTLLAALDITLERAKESALYGELLRGIRIHALDDFRKIPLTTREDLQKAGPHGTRAVPLDRVCHYGETSGTSGGTANSTWLTHEDFAINARAIKDRHPELFSPGRIILNRFPFMAAPAHLVQLIAQMGGGIAIPAGNINWDVPFPRALELARSTGAQTFTGLPSEPLVLAQIARSQGIDPASDTKLDGFFLGGAPLPPALVRRLRRVWNARIIDLYGSTETMLLGTGCDEGTLHLETGLAYTEILQRGSDEPVQGSEEGRLVVTTLAVEGSPLVRFETGDLVRRTPPCACGDERPGIVVLGRESEVVEMAGGRFYSHDVIDAAAAAADSIDSSIFFLIVLPDRFLLRIEAPPSAGDPSEVFRQRLGDVPLEIELVAENELLDVELLSRSPKVYKPVVMSDWRGEGRKVVSVGEGMIEWPRLSGGEAWRWLGRTLRSRSRRRKLSRGLRVAREPKR